jgi:hypothetical protein
MNGIRHPFSRALYEQDGTGNILVTDGDRSGRFRPDGSWIDGELRECDLHICGWVAGPQFANHRMADSTPASTPASANNR